MVWSCRMFVTVDIAIEPQTEAEEEKIAATRAVFRAATRIWRLEGGKGSMHSVITSTVLSVVSGLSALSLGCGNSSLSAWSRKDSK